MTDLKLPKLPDRTPVKLAISLSADLNQALKAYASRYEAAYGVREPVVDLIPYMLEAYILSDKADVRANRK